MRIYLLIRKSNKQIIDSAKVGRLDSAKRIFEERGVMPKTDWVICTEEVYRANEPWFQKLF